MKDGILKSFGIRESALLGEGGEVWAYRLDSARALRIYKRNASIKSLAKLQQFYLDLKRGSVPFAVPQIINYGQIGDYSYTIDDLMQGSELGKTLAELTGISRDRALESYWKTSRQIINLADDFDYFGEILTEEPLRTDTWPEFLRKKALQVYDRTCNLLSYELPDVGKVMRFFQAECAIVADVRAKLLVHGDYYPANVFIDSRFNVCGVADFNTLAVVGDQRMDIAGAIIFLEVTSTTSAHDSEVLLAKATTLYGGTFRRIIHLYRLYYCFIFSDCKESDPRTYQWCIDGLKCHLQGSTSY